MTVSISHDLHAHITDEGVVLSETEDMSAPTLVIRPEVMADLAEYMDENSDYEKLFDTVQENI